MIIMINNSRNMRIFPAVDKGRGRIQTLTGREMKKRGADDEKRRNEERRVERERKM